MQIEIDKIFVDCTANYKTSMEYKHLYFNAHNPAQCTDVRQQMSAVYPYYFGQSEAVVIETTMGKEEKAGAEMINDVVTKGYNRIQETMK